MSALETEFPEKLDFLFEPHRYKVAYGGRGGAKSWGFARALLELGYQKPLRILCAREIQQSIKDSSHALLKAQVSELGLDSHYEVLANEIRGANGTEFTFAGLKHNIGSIKSKEGIDICWVEEAQAVSRSSWETLVPTIRKDGSEIWISFNPELEEDETYQRFVVRPPTGAVVRKIDYRDNAWFPSVLEQERLDLLTRDPVAYQNVWEGHCKRAVEGAIYAAELSRAQDEERIGRVPHDPSKPVHTFWDLGWADTTSIWIAQPVGAAFHVIDYVEGTQKDAAEFVRLLQAKPYSWGDDFLPHDADNELQAASGRSIASQLRALGRNVRIVEKTSIADGINAARTIFGQCGFDSEKCADGLHALRHYRFDVDDDGRLSRKPLHDWASHPADAFRYLAVSIQAQRPKKPARAREGSWMS